MSLAEYRCPTCGRLLFKTDAPAGRVQLPCPRCDAVKMVEVKAAPARLTGRCA